MSQGILLTVDYHDENCVIRRRDLGRSTEEVLTVPTTAGDLLAVVAEARRRAGPRGRVVWLQESTTGWARVRAAIGKRAEVGVANVWQLPLPRKGPGGKTDDEDAARRERGHRPGCSGSASTANCRWRTSRRRGGDRCGAWWAAARTW